MKNICPAALGSKDQQPASYDPATNLVFVPTNHVCMTYEPFQVEYAAGQPYVGATLTMFPAPNSHGGMGNFIVWDASTGTIKWSLPERFSVWSGVLTTDGNVAFYGTLEGYLKAVSTKDGKELWKFKLPSGIIGNVFTYEYQGRQYLGRVLRDRRLGRHRHGGRPDRDDRGPRRGRRLQGPRAVHHPRRHAVRVRPAAGRRRPRGGEPQ